MTEFKNFSLKEIIAMIQSGKTTQKEVYEYFLTRIKNLDPQLEAFNLIHETASEQDVHSPLAGVPIGVKDVFSEIGIKTTAASKMLASYKPPYDATIISCLKEAGFSSIGKLNMDEFAMGGSGENSAMRITRNPWDTERIPGGSSSGSASAVASGMVPAALGTDTGGSIRQPASMCGIVGFKSTYGRNSRKGVISMASSLDTPGTFTKTVEDAAFLYEIMAGYDAGDSMSLQEPTAINPAIWDKKDLKGIKIGIPKEYFIEGIEKGVQKEIDGAINTLRELGAEIKDVSLPHTEYGLAVYYIVMPAEVSTNLSRYDGIRFGHTHGGGADIAMSRSEGFGKEAQRRIMLGSFVLSSGFYDAYYRRASLVRELIKDDFKKAFEEVDIIITPTAPSVAWKIGEKVDDPLKMYLSDIFTVNGSLAGLPGLSLPVGYTLPEDGGIRELPVGLQILGPLLGEEKVFEVAYVLQQNLKENINEKKPQIF
ncbi:glutaminyl-tRNA synthase (glutamine-hydrolyzing) subunit A [Candidatus Gracilibacteria bacterium CG2_30_37_12]|nr:MAG: glutaminyl-tRNA synthase (glutamine-hydrolyzing) subunit A [Candidatus Gracilibacteria bacterium CG2_30_37_12]